MGWLHVWKCAECLLQTMTSGFWTLVWKQLATTWGLSIFQALFSPFFCIVPILTSMLKGLPLHKIRHASVFPDNYTCLKTVRYRRSVFLWHLTNTLASSNPVFPGGCNRGPNTSRYLSNIRDNNKWCAAALLESKNAGTVWDPRNILTDFFRQIGRIKLAKPIKVGDSHVSQETPPPPQLPVLQTTVGAPPRGEHLKWGWLSNLVCSAS